MRVLFSDCNETIDYVKLSLSSVVKYGKNIKDSLHSRSWFLSSSWRAQLGRDHEPPSKKARE